MCCMLLHQEEAYNQGDEGEEGGYDKSNMVECYFSKERVFLDYDRRQLDDRYLILEPDSQS